MNKLFGFLIVWLLLAIWGIIYSDHNPQFADSLCKRISFCNHSIINQSEKDIIQTWNFDESTTVVKEKIYPQILFDPYTTWDMEIYKRLQSQWIQCKDIEWFVIGGDALPGCLNITWYEHTYTIPKIGIKIVAYNNMLPTSLDNPWLIHKDILMPFLLSWNRIYEQQWKTMLWSYPYIEYHDILPWKTKHNVLEQAKTKNYNGFVYDQERWITTIETGSFYMVSYRKWEEYPLFIQYHFKDNKSYYYTMDNWPDCMPWPCGLARHDIQLFTK